MARNIEIKAKAENFERQKQLAAALTKEPPQLLHQKDIFYHTTNGRLKLRFENGRGTLIGYNRPNEAGPKLSNYILSYTAEPDSLNECLAMVLQTRGIVEKTRWVYLIDQTRVHLDQVQGLGAFLELEVVLRQEQTLKEGEAIAQAIMKQLEISPECLCTHAYIDLQEQQVREKS